MIIREATPEDADDIAAVAADAWWAGPASALSADAVRLALADLYDESFLAEVAAEAADEEDFRFLVAVAEEGADGDGDGEVVGFASATREWTDEAELFTLYVDPDHWGEGIGTALLTELESWAAGRGAERLVCSALADNTVAVGYLESRGFERIREVEAEVGGETVGEYEFEKPLD
ncbi:GNAT family N-acetyltransferase [Haloglomus litoreum]|uniref:GNAT family N-acetyltransferase n=1 Tax=Haloglomus litoreum TaxID=3034026 RepID=UPI0023E81491|nr:GNAT family N-acetyltransferase [Haloglomus sp. DT116]